MSHITTKRFIRQILSDREVIKINLRYYFKRHRIQGGKAIVSLVIRNDIPLLEEGSKFLEWIGDAYELRDELNKQIEALETKYKKK